jgi:hypothetical protein
MTKTDNQLKEDIEQELRWDPKVNAAQIGVSVDKGAVSLLGAVDTYAEKWAAEDATKRVFGVRTVARISRSRFSPTTFVPTRISPPRYRALSSGTCLFPTPSLPRFMVVRSPSKVRSLGTFSGIPPSGQFAISPVLFPLLMPSRSSHKSPRRRSKRKSWQRCSDMRRQTPSRSRSMHPEAR